jgi:hypothetical protein
MDFPHRIITRFARDGKHRSELARAARRRPPV